ncbi:MAG TPA: hypothetical protein VEY30_02425 [Myxococcaceae bacterium]|nr:hypothetical protein [Myxococcaceae bacterium]
MITLSRSTLGLACALLTGCGDLFYAEVEVPEVCVTEADAGLEGVPVPGTHTVSRAFNYDIGSALGTITTEGVDSEARLLTLTLTANRGISDMDFLDAIQVYAAAPPDSGLSDLKLVDYQQPAAAQGARTISLTAQQDNIIPYVTADALKLNVTFTGQIPQSSWSVDARGCLYIRGKYKYLSGDGEETSR